MAKDTVGVGVIGTGFARTTQLPAWAACGGARVVAVASGRRENAEAAAREFGIPFVADDWRGVVGRDDVDLVSIVTPPATHAEMVAGALASGKAVLCEKPMAMSAGESARMCAEARGGRGRLVLIDHELRFLPARRQMREMIQAGDVGRVRHVRGVFRADSRARAEGAWSWWSDEKMGGGVLGAIGSHVIDALLWLTGARVSHVGASLATHVPERPHAESGERRRVTTDDEANMLLSFADGGVTEGATGVVAMSMVEAGEPEHTVEVFGSEGALRVTREGRLWHARVGEGAWREVEAGRAPLAEGMRDSEWSRGFTAFSREIVAALAEGRDTVEGAATFEDGHRTQLVLDAARASHASGRRVAVAMSDER
ncbi:MAG TPA: Gfo/Idh/MocA family oxidoreductase [Pyrinomonadaceae bacterium]|nr:Gfo/Idh/MocA family oxidoreductase [Pyrinomonadaceae bacterium]